MNDKVPVKRSDRFFNLQEPLLYKVMKLVFPPFLKAKKQFSNADDQRTKQVANSRIHVGCVIDRMKDFDIMKAELPLEMFDIFLSHSHCTCCSS